jgi:hypothetical protein
MAWKQNGILVLVVVGMAVGAVGCAYDPPPEVRLVAPTGNRFLLGDPIVLEFSEPVRPESLEVRVWPGKKDLYDLEGVRLPEVQPLLGACTVAAAPCKDGVALTLADDRRTAALAVGDGALGPEGQPLVLEVTGSLQDDQGRRKKVSRFFDFQIVRDIWNPTEDVLGGDVAGDADAADVPPIPVTVAQGSHFFFAQFTSPIELPQQFWCDIRVQPDTGRFLIVLTDADPVDGTPRNTTDPTQCVVDTGVEGFIFTAQGKLHQATADADPTFEGDAFTLSLLIGPILFELRDVVMRGTVSVQDGLSRWDGTMAVREVYYKVGDIEEFYPSDQANFQMTQLRTAEVPPTMGRVCDATPCTVVGGKCDLPAGTWPIPAFCP